MVADNTLWSGNVADPEHHDEWTEVIRAYNSIYGHSPKRTFLGYYADVSSLAPDVAHRISVRVPALPAGRFQGVFFENVEPERTAVIR